ncbi:hypothetical protein MWU57_08685 [Isoptericola sp. S6320L]|uniref:hypothetical protein n=1 Tax=Isoptericola sp. S6320L TaxID=2926411 RepID=UPI001FF32AF5|nr:hypothetical protein [Isoptericola sp. S6320L]MCK0117109.1 hypothetical protein [Isoptericola sp. S6320L]
MGAPWEDGPVFTFAPRDGWVFWTAGLDGHGWANVAAQVAGGDDDDQVVGAVRDHDERATADGQAWGAGLRFPPHHDRTPVAMLLVRSFAERGDVDKAYRTFVKQARKMPRIKDVTVSSYDVGEATSNVGRLVEQVIDTVDARSEALVSTWRYTIFPPDHDEVVSVEVDTLHAHMVDAVEDELVELLAYASYTAPEASPAAAEEGGSSPLHPVVRG